MSGQGCHGLHGAFVGLPEAEDVLQVAELLLSLLIDTYNPSFWEVGESGVQDCFLGT